jgi:predicted permease
LVLIQVAVSLVLVFGATLFVRSLVNLDANRTGSAIDQLVLARLAPLPSSADDAITPSYYPELIRRVSGVAGVRSASLSRLFPGISDEAAMFTKIAAAERPLDASAGGAVIDTVSPGFFASAGIPLLRGRDFAWQDGDRSPNVAIVNVSAARRLFASSEAVGRRIRIGTDPSLQSVEVIGLVDDAMIGNVRAPHVPVIMRPVLQNLRFARYSAVVIRTDVPGEALTRAVQRAVATLGKDYVSDVRPAKDMLRRSVAKDQVMAALSLLFGGVAVAIAFVGVFGAMALDVSRRRREIGVRMALGADRQRVARSVIGKALTTTAWGTALGVPCALAASSAAGSLLYGLAPSDPVSLAGAGALVVAVCVLGSLVPAMRAASVDPVTTLRAE